MNTQLGIGIGIGISALVLMAMASADAAASPNPNPQAPPPGLGRAAELTATLPPFAEQKWTEGEKIASTDQRLRLGDLLRNLRAEGWQPLVTLAWRTLRTQDILHARSQQGAKGWSLHCAVGAAGQPAALAVDIVDSRYSMGRANPTALNGAAAFFRRLGAHAAALGLEWGGAWTQTDPVWGTYGLGYDPEHVQVADVSVSSARDGSLVATFGPGQIYQGKGGYAYRLWFPPMGTVIQIVQAPRGGAALGSVLCPVASGQAQTAILAELGIVPPRLA